MNGFIDILCLGETNLKANCLEDERFLNHFLMSHVTGSPSACMTSLTPMQPVNHSLGTQSSIQYSQVSGHLSKMQLADQCQTSCQRPTPIHGQN